MCCEAIEKEVKLSIAAPLIDITSAGGELFSVARPLQVRMALAAEMVDLIVLF